MATPPLDVFGRPLRDPELARQFPLVNPVGQDYAGRLVGHEGVLGIEGKHLSNIIDPTPFMTANERLAAAQAQQAQEQAALAQAFQQDQMLRGQQLVNQAQGISGGVLDQAAQVAAMSPQALQATGATADEVARQAALVSSLGPAAVEAANQSAARMGNQANVISQLGPQAILASQEAARGMRGQAGDLRRRFTDPAAQALGQFGAAQTGLYGSSFMPIEQQIADFARTFDTAQRRADEAGRARADVASEFGRQRAINERRLASMGIDPSMGSGRSLQFDLAEAASRAAAAENARRQVEQQGALLRAQAAGIGAGIAGRGTAATQAGANLGAQGAQTAAGILQGAGGLEQQGLQTGTNIGATAADIFGRAGGLQQQGIASGANIGATAGNLLSASGDLRNRGFQTAGNLGLGAGGLGMDALRGLSTGTVQGTNIQAEGLGARESVLPFSDRVQGGLDRNTAIMTDFNQGVWSTQGNRQAGPSVLGGALGGLTQALGQVGSSWLGSRRPISPGVGSRDGGADGGFLGSTRQRYADGGLNPVGIPVASWLSNAPVQPVIGRADGGVTVEPGCQLIGNEPRMPDGSRCEVQPANAVTMADGGNLVIPALKAIVPIAATAMGGPVAGAVAGGVMSQVPDSSQQQQSGTVRPLPAQQPMPAQQTAPAQQPMRQPIPVADGTHKGPVLGPSDGTGVDDQVPAQLSAGEYVIPADVVARKGTEFFDKLLEKHHVPAAVQREQMGVIG